jgi:uncharacterized integral membrane protein
MSTWKGVVAGTVIACLVLFIFQNREVLQLRFLFWEFETRRSFMLIAVFAAGLLIGWIVATISQLGARSREAAAAHAAAHAAQASHPPHPDKQEHRHR